MAGRLLALLVTATLASACAARGPAPGTASLPAPGDTQRADSGTAGGRQAVLEALVEQLDTHYRGEAAAVIRIREAVDDQRASLLASDVNTFYERLNSILADAGQDHLYLYRPARDVFDRDPLEDHLLGASLRDVDGFAFVDDVWEGGPAAEGGLLYGDQLLPIDGREPVLDPLPAGTQTVRLWVRRQRDQAPFFLDLETARGDTAWYLSESTRASLRQLPRGSCRIGYLHLRSFTDEELIQELATGAHFNDSHGLILDLRGNRGGEVRLAGEILDLLSREPSLWIHYRDRAYPFPATSWNLPLAVLVDGTTRSAAEIFAAAVQSRGLGILVGSRTAGQVRGSRLFPLPDGSRLLLPVSDVTWPGGAALEHRGVSPDVAVTRPLMFAAGTDPVKDEALRLLEEQLACPEELPEETFPHEALSPGPAAGGGGASPPVP